MSGRIFLDGTGVTPGSEGCKCGGECEFPCWQRLGIATPCGECGCKIDTGYPPEATSSDREQAS